MTRHRDKNDGSDRAAYAERLARDIARLKEKGSKRTPKRAPHALRSPEFESGAHAETIDAVRDGRLRIDEYGAFAAVSAEDRERVDLPRSVGAKMAGYKAAGMPMAQVPAALRFRAKALAHLLDVVASSDEAPAEFIERATRALDAALAVGGTNRRARRK